MTSSITKNIHLCGHRVTAERLPTKHSTKPSNKRPPFLAPIPDTFPPTETQSNSSDSKSPIRGHPSERAPLSKSTNSLSPAHHYHLVLLQTLASLTRNRPDSFTDWPKTIHPVPSSLQTLVTQLPLLRFRPTHFNQPICSRTLISATSAPLSKSSIMETRPR